MNFCKYCRRGFVPSKFHPKQFICYSKECRKKGRKEWSKKYLENNRDKFNKYNREYKNKRYQTDPVYRKEVNKKNKRLHGWQKHKLPLILEQKNICALCNKEMFLDTKLIHVDHIIPRSKGGPDNYENLQAVHAECNLRKGNKNEK